MEFRHPDTNQKPNAEPTVSEAKTGTVEDRIISYYKKLHSILLFVSMYTSFLVLKVLRESMFDTLGTFKLPYIISHTQWESINSDIS